MLNTNAHILRLLAIAAIALAALALPGAAGAATLYVDSTSNAPSASCGSEATPCETIDEGIARAASGDLIRVAAGDYAGATIDRRIRLVGVQAGTSGAARGLDAARTSTIRGTLFVQADAVIDGFEFAGIASGPALRFGATLPGEGTGASSINNNTFSGVASGQVVFSDVAADGLSFSDNLFVNKPGSAGIGLFLHGELVPGKLRSLRIERNRFEGFAGAAGSTALDIGGAPGLQIRYNSIIDSTSLLTIADTDSSGGPSAAVFDNSGSGFTGPALKVGKGVRDLAIEHNVLSGGLDAALRLSGARGTGSSSGVSARGNDISGFTYGVHASGDAHAGIVVVRGNRIVAINPGGLAVSNTMQGGFIDARANWWGRSSGVTAGNAVGAADVSEPLRLIGVDAPAAVHVGGSGVVSVRLASTADGAPEASARGFSVIFGSSSANLDAARVAVSGGVASTMITAGTTPGTTTTTVVLDAERVSAMTLVQSIGTTLPTGPAIPGDAETTPLVLRAGARFTAGNLARALSRGIIQIASSNRSTSVRATISVSPYTAKLLGLRAQNSASREPFVIGRVRTRAAYGSRPITIRLSRRARFAIQRADRRVELRVSTQLRTAAGQQRSFYYRLVLPANVR